MIIYVVTSGEYSDYKIEAVFTIKQLAEEYVNDYNRAKRSYGAEIEEFESDVPVEVRFGVEVLMGKNGNVLDTELLFDISLEHIGFVWFSKPDPKYPYSSIKEECFRWVVETDNIERAVKVVNEKRSQILANNLWLGDEGVKQYFTRQKKEEGSK